MFDSLFIFHLHGGNEKKRTTRATLGVKKEFVAEHENGFHVSYLASKYSVPKSSISTFLKNKGMINAANVAKGSKAISRQRPQVIEEVETLLLVFINGKLLKGDSLSEAFVREKALCIYGGENSNDFDFKASKGWFQKLEKTKWNSQCT